MVRIGGSISGLDLDRRNFPQIRMLSFTKKLVKVQEDLKRRVKNYILF